MRLAVQEYVVHAVSFDGALQRHLLRVQPREWTSFAAATKRAADSFRRANKETDVAPEALARETLAKYPHEPLRAARGWFWDALARATQGRWSEPNQSQTQPFDARWAYDGVAFLGEAARRAGWSSACAQTVLELHRRFERHEKLTWRVVESTAGAAAPELARLCAAVMESFQLRVVRAPHHWVRSTTEQEYCLCCPSCRRVKTDVVDGPVRRRLRGAQYVSYNVERDVFTCARKTTKTKEDDEEEDHCHTTECVPLEMGGNILECWGRLMAACWSCGQLTLMVSGTRTHEFVCAACRRETDHSSIRCALCHRRGKTTPPACEEDEELAPTTKRRRPAVEPSSLTPSRWREVRVFRLPQGDGIRTVYFCPKESGDWSTRARIMSHSVLEDMIRDHNARRARRPNPNANTHHARS